MATMQIAVDIFVILHMVGLGALFGGFFVQIKALKAGTAVMNPAMLHGGLTMLVSGLVLFALAIVKGISGFFVAKLIIKLIVLLGILALVLIYQRREHAPSWAVITVGGLTFVDICIAVLWA